MSGKDLSLPSRELSFNSIVFFRWELVHYDIPIVVHAQR